MKDWCSTLDTSSASCWCLPVRTLKKMMTALVRKHRETTLVRTIPHHSRRSARTCRAAAPCAAGPAVGAGRCAGAAFGRGLEQPLAAGKVPVPAAGGVACQGASADEYVPLSQAGRPLPRCPCTARCRLAPCAVRSAGGLGQAVLCG